MLDTNYSLASPTRLTLARWAILAFAFASIALLLMSWRWGGTIEDSQAYFDTALYLKGEIPKEQLRSPFPYRLFVPAVAAMLPGDIRNGFAALNWLFITFAALLTAATVIRSGMSKGQGVIAGLLMIISLPTVWYAPYLLVDPGSVFARAAFVLAVVSGQPLLAIVAGLVGTAIREENILLLVWLVLFRQTGIFSGLISVATALGWILAVRWWLIPGLPSYTWEPSWWSFTHNLKDVRTIASIAGTSIIILPLALIGLRRSPKALHRLIGLTVLMAAPVTYAALCVRVDGRAIWGLYPFLIPFAVSYFSKFERLGKARSVQ